MTTSRVTPFIAALGLTVVGSACPAEAQTILSESFDNVPVLFSSGGWAKINRSSPPPVPPTAGDWHQGAGSFSAHVGAFNACISADFGSGSGVATISNWLMTPAVTLQNGQSLRFYTRTRNPPQQPDRMQVRLSLAGTSTDVGTTATSVGVFTTLLLDINPTYQLTGYPSSWTEFNITLSGIAAPTQGRIAFRYFVEEGGPQGLRSDIVAVDTLTLTAAAPNPCQEPLPLCSGDIAGNNGVVNIDDLLAVISSWGSQGPPRPVGDAAPLPNGDCLVNIDDLLQVVSMWGACPSNIGACCLPNGNCLNGQTSAGCAAAGGTYQSHGSICGLVNCPQPNNDLCEQATAVAVGGSVSGDLATASNDFSPTCNGVPPGRGRWHTVLGNGTTLTATICASSGSFDGRLTVYCGSSCNGLLCVTAADSNSCATNKETVSWCSAFGQTYRILVHAPTAAAGQGAYTLNVVSGATCTGAVPCAPINDDCSAALPIFNGTTAFSTIGATTDGFEVAPGACNDSGATQTAADIWYRYTATCTGTLRVTTCAQLGGFTDYDSDIVIYIDGACPPPDSSRVGCNDDDPNNPCGIDPPFASTAMAPVVSGQTYLVRVGGFQSKKLDFGTGVLNVTCMP